MTSQQKKRVGGNPTTTFESVKQMPRSFSKERRTILMPPDTPPMHALIITSQLLHSALLQNALQRHNIKSISCLPSSLTSDWHPQTDAFIFSSLLEAEDWKRLLPFLLNASPKLPFIFLYKHTPDLFRNEPFKGLLKQSIFLDETLPIDEIPLLIKDLIRKSPLFDKGKQIQVGAFLLDRSQRTAVYEKMQVQLTKKEFFLLELLIQNVGRITTRESIIDYVWDRRSYVGSNTIDVYISRLRRKLQFDPEHYLIRTVPCLGYQFIPPLS